MKNWMPSVFLFALGGCLYCIIEILWRGYSHWSMALAGGSCFFSIDFLNRKIKKTTPLWVRCTLGAVVITAIEFITGCLVNLWAHWHIWDYSRLRFQLLGQISLTYSCIWFFLTAPMLWLAKALRRRIEHLFRH